MNRTGTNAGLHAIAGETRDPYRWIVLGVTSVGALLAALTSGTLVIALPQILRYLHTDLFSLMWIVVGYTLAATVLVLNAGLGAVVSASRGKQVAFEEATVPSQVAVGPPCSAA